jgi:hypothetical protein
MAPHRQFQKALSVKENPLNRLPIDPEWVRKADALAEAAAKELGMVVLVAIQEGGKLGVCVAGQPAKGPLAELAGDMPQLFLSLASACGLNDAIETAIRRARQGVH